MLRFHKTYFILTVLLFVTEVLIALFVHDEIVRPYIGDVLVVILIYCFVRSFLNSPVGITALVVLLFAYLIEVLQYLNIVEQLGLNGSPIARTVIGTYFTWVDILAYTVGVIIVLVVERLKPPRPAGSGFWKQRV